MATYTAPIEDMMFLFEKLRDNSHYNELEKYKEVNPDLAKDILEQAAKITENLILPLAKTGDETPAKLENGIVRTPPGYKEAYKKFIEDGWVSLSCEPKYGGQGIPNTIKIFFDEMLSSASLSFKLYSELSIGAYNCILYHGNDSIKKRFLPNMVKGTWSGTMCLTEPVAGTDLGLLKTKAIEQSDGTYKLTGQKIFITSGDHDLTENIIHLVLARIPDAPAGIKGISLFLVPKIQVKEDGSLGPRNGVLTNSIENKMGIRGSATCVLNFDGAVGHMIGSKNRGLSSMFIMMNLERIVVGIQGLGLSEIAYQNALNYSKERKQGKVSGNKSNESDFIIKHADIRRSLMNMKSLIEGERSFAFWLSQQMDVSLNHKDSKIKNDSSDIVSLLTPVVKSFFTDTGVEITNDAIQVFGGYGYTKDQGIERLFRDNRITPIYEGTNSVQAIDLVFRKIANKGIFEKYLTLINDEIKECNNLENLKPFIEKFEKYKELMINFTNWLRNKIETNKDDASAACNDYLKVLGYTSLAFSWIKVLKVSYIKINKNKEFFEDKINTGSYFFDKILPRIQSHYLAGISGSSSTMKSNFN